MALKEGKKIRRKTDDKIIWLSEYNNRSLHYIGVGDTGYKNSIVFDIEDLLAEDWEVIQ